MGSSMAIPSWSHYARHHGYWTLIAYAYGKTTQGKVPTRIVRILLFLGKNGDELRLLSIWKSGPGERPRSWAKSYSAKDLDKALKEVKNVARRWQRRYGMMMTIKLPQEERLFFARLCGEPAVDPPADPIVRMDLRNCF